MRYVWLLALSSLVIWQLWGRVQARPGEDQARGSASAGEDTRKSKSQKSKSQKSKKRKSSKRKSSKRKKRKTSEKRKSSKKRQDAPSPPKSAVGVADLAPLASAESMRQKVRIGTWNLRRLGHGDKRLDWVVRVIDRDFDIIALQEVMTEEGVKELVAMLPGWAVEISPRPVGTDKYQEWYAVLYRHAHARVTRSFFLGDSKDQLIREPFTVCMDVYSFDFCLVSAHIVFGDRAADRDAEIDALGDKLIALRKRDERERDWLLVGDFNRMPRAPGWDRLRAAGWDFTLPGRVATSLGKRGYASPYDHILVDGRYSGELEGQSRRVDIIVDPCGGDLDVCRMELSDHAPVVATFRTDGADDD